MLTQKWHRKANNASNSDIGFFHSEIKTHTQENILDLVSGQEPPRQTQTGFLFLLQTVVLFVFEISCLDGGSFRDNQISEF